MNLGANIYTLRKAKGLTQGQLGEKLSVSEQTVSKWENGVCAPDVGMLPKIAGFFGVSIDRLFNYSLAENGNEIEKIIKAAENCNTLEEEIAALKAGLAGFPNSNKLKTQLATAFLMAFRISDGEAEKKNAIAEAIGLCTEVVDHSADPATADEALSLLTRIYSESGQHKKALEALEKISAENWFSRLTDTAAVLAAAKDLVKTESFVEENLFLAWLACDLNLQTLIHVLRENGDHSAAADFCRARYTLLSVFDGGAEDFFAAHKLFCAYDLALACKAMGDKTGCAEALEKLKLCAGQIAAQNAEQSFHIGQRNKKYFSHVTDKSLFEEILIKFSTQHLLGQFEDFLN